VASTSAWPRDWKVGGLAFMPPAAAALEGWWVGVDVGLVAAAFGGDGVVVLLASGACA